MKTIVFFIVILFAVISSHAQIGNFEISNITENTLVASTFINDNEGCLADNKGNLWHTANEVTLLSG